MRNRLGWIMLCTVALSGAAMVGSAAEKEPATVDIESAMQSGEIMPLEQIIQRAKARFPGRITEIELGFSDGRYMVEIDVMDDSGVKRELKIDAKTAEILSSEIDDDDADEVAAAPADDEGAAADDDDDDDDDDDEG